MEVCNLCNQTKELCNSHIFPKFISNWLKKTGTGLLRGTWDLNRRIQDGIKTPFLCNECENLFNKSETYFSNNIFFPVVNHNAEMFDYDNKLFHFTISIFWRLLKYDILKNEKDSPYYNILVAAEQEWRSYLLNKDPIKNYNRLHLLISVDPLSQQDIEESDIEVPEHFVLYMARMTDGGIADNDESCILFVKLPRFFFILPLVGIDEKLYVNSRVSEENGKFVVEKVCINDPSIGEFILSRVKLLNSLYENISEEQRKKMQEAYIKNKEQITKNDLGKIINYSDRKYPNNKN